jgi:hypothetical protein
VNCPSEAFPTLEERDSLNVDKKNALRKISTLYTKFTEGYQIYTGEIIPPKVNKKGVVLS